MIMYLRWICMDTWHVSQRIDELHIRMALIFELIPYNIQAPHETPTLRILRPVVTFIISSSQ
jgi:hypothetical protein